MARRRYKFTARRKSALRKAQLVSARKRKKSRLSKAKKAYRRNKTNIQRTAIGAGVVGAMVLGGLSTKKHYGRNVTPRTVVPPGPSVPPPPRVEPSKPGKAPDVTDVLDAIEEEWEPESMVVRPRARRPVTHTTVTHPLARAIMGEGYRNSRGKKVKVIYGRRPEPENG